MKTPKDFDDYIAGFPNDVQRILKKIRATIKKTALATASPSDGGPALKEKISYQMPAFTLNGNLVYFAAFKKHIGFYPRTTAIKKFRKELAPYAGAKGSVRFPLDKPIPYDLIAKIVRYRVRENLAR